MTPEEALSHLRGAGFEPWEATVMLAIGYAETAGSLDEHQVHVVLNEGNPAHRSVDWNLWGINDFWQEDDLAEAGIIDPERTLSQQLLDPAIAAKAAKHIYDEARGGGDMMSGFEPWNTFGSGEWLWYISHAETVARAEGVIQWSPKIGSDS